jgi:hypothetical protein
MHISALSGSSSSGLGVQFDWDDPEELLQHLAVRTHFTGSDEQALAKQQQHEQYMRELLEFLQYCKAAAAAEAAALAARQQLAGSSSSSNMQRLIEAAAAAAFEFMPSPAASAAGFSSAEFATQLSAWQLFNQFDASKPELANALRTAGPYTNLMMACELWEDSAWQQSDGASSFRRLLWSLLQQLKPSVQPFYQQMLAASKGSRSEAGKPPHQPGSSSSSSEDIVNEAPPELWEAVGASIAADLILVPPAFRDLLATGWTGGAGRLPPAVASSGSSVAVAAATAAAAADAASSAEEQQRSAAAARLLVVQYARTLRRSSELVSVCRAAAIHVCRGVKFDRTRPWLAVLLVCWLRKHHIWFWNGLLPFLFCVCLCVFAPLAVERLLLEYVTALFK